MALTPEELAKIFNTTPDKIQPTASKIESQLGGLEKETSYQEDFDFGYTYKSDPY